MTTLTTNRTAFIATGARPGTLTGRVFALLGLYQSRRSLTGLDDAMLRDIGLTRKEATQESRRPLWDVPANWRA